MRNSTTNIYRKYESFTSIFGPSFVLPHLVHIGQLLSINKALSKIEVSGHGAVDEVEGVIYRVERNRKVDFLTKFVKPSKVDGIYLPENNNGETIWNWKAL